MTINRASNIFTRNTRPAEAIGLDRLIGAPDNRIPLHGRKTGAIDVRGRNAAR
jgi:hypothetical protein